MGEERDRRAASASSAGALFLRLLFAVFTLAAGATTGLALGSPRVNEVPPSGSVLKKIRFARDCPAGYTTPQFAGESRCSFHSSGVSGGGPAARIFFPHSKSDHRPIRPSQSGIRGPGTKGTMRTVLASKRQRSEAVMYGWRA